MKPISVLATSVLFLLFITAATIAQPGNRSGMTSTQFQMGSWADPRGYFFEVRYGGNTAPLVQARPHNGMLVISIGQASAAPGFAFQNQMSQRYPLPMDADPSRMRRYDQQGRILIVVPRRQTGSSPRW